MTLEFHELDLAKIKRSITAWHFCCVATMQEYKQQWLTRQQEMLVIHP
jgi:hypothetical protein